MDGDNRRRRRAVKHLVVVNPPVVRDDTTPAPARDDPRSGHNATVADASTGMMMTKPASEWTRLQDIAEQFEDTREIDVEGEGDAAPDPAGYEPSAPDELKQPGVEPRALSEADPFQRLARQGPPEPRTATPGRHGSASLPRTANRPAKSQTPVHSAAIDSKSARLRSRPGRRGVMLAGLLAAGITVLGLAAAGVLGNRTRPRPSTASVSGMQTFAASVAQAVNAARDELTTAGRLKQRVALRQRRRQQALTRTRTRPHGRAEQVERQPTTSVTHYASETPTTTPTAAPTTPATTATPTTSHQAFGVGGLLGAGHGTDKGDS